MTAQLLSGDSLSGIGRFVAAGWEALGCSISQVRLGTYVHTLYSMYTILLLWFDDTPNKGLGNIADISQ